MSSPNLTIAIEPFQDGSARYLPLAPATSTASLLGQFEWELLITNNEAQPVHVPQIITQFKRPSTFPVSCSNGLSGLSQVT